MPILPSNRRGDQEFASSYRGFRIIEVRITERQLYSPFLKNGPHVLQYFLYHLIGMSIMTVCHFSDNAQLSQTDLSGEMQIRCDTLYPRKIKKNETDSGGRNS